MDDELVEIDGRHRRIVFRGDCDQMRPICRALCCREWVVPISAEELATGYYDVEAICTLTEKPCSAPSGSCIQRSYHLARREDQSCVYLEDDRCSIYAKRPRTCREFTCRGGWRLHSVMPIEARPTASAGLMPTKAEFVERLSEEMVFLPHPLLKLHTVFCLPSRREVVFIKEKVGTCGIFTTRSEFDVAPLDDAGLMRLIDLFSRKEPLGQVYRRYGTTEITLPQFYEIVWLLNRHGVVLDSSNFKGMLGGIGALG